MFLCNKHNIKLKKLVSRKLYSLPSNIKEHDWTLNLSSHVFSVVELDVLNCDLNFLFVEV